MTEMSDPGSAVVAPATPLLSDRPAEDGVMRIGATRVGYAYIFSRADPNPLSDSDLLFNYDLAGNQIQRTVEMLS